MSDLISRQAAIDALNADKIKRCRFEYINACKIVAHPTPDTSKNDIYDAYAVMKALYPIFGDEECEEPSAQPEIIRCKDCKWWDKYSDTHGYCSAAKHGYWSEHWEISIRRTYDADWYCADAERRTDER